jgi:hypothetical protein
MPNDATGASNEYSMMAVPDKAPTVSCVLMINDETVP